MPAWLAVMEHVPAETMATVLPATVQTGVVVEAKLTAKPELAVALTCTGGELRVTLGRGPKLMFCEAGFTAKLCVTAGATA